MNASNLTDTPLPRYEEGESLSRIWVVRSLGIDPASGDEILLKRNGEMTSAVNWSANDVVPIGNTEPTWQGYINSSFTYKGWGADVSFRYQFGGQVYNQTLLDKVENANLKYNVDRRVSQLRWAKPGDKAQFRTLTPVVGKRKLLPGLSWMKIYSREVRCLSTIAWIVLIQNLSAIGD